VTRERAFICLNLCLLVATAVALHGHQLQTDLANAQAAINLALKDAAAMPVVSPSDQAILNLLHSPAEAAAYASLVACAGNANCKLITAIYLYPGPGPWTPNTAYAVGSYVTDVSGNVYELVGQAGTSTATTPAWNISALGAQTSDGPLTWDYIIPAGGLRICGMGQ
jgi:hypothetical protein